MIRRIVVPLDGSELSQAALPIARGIAAQTGAAITLISVIDPPRDFYIVSEGHSGTRLRPSDIDHLASEEKRLDHYLTGLATRLEGVETHTDVHLGHPAEEIIADAEATRGSMVVMSSHGRTGLGRALLGSIASRVVQGASFPVVVTRATEHSKDQYGTKEIKRVIVPLDGSTFAERALASVHSIFGPSVEYVLVRVIEPVAPGQAYAPETVAEYDRQARASTEEYLAKLADQLSDEGATVVTRYRSGAPANGIIEAAEEAQADLIAMSTHGRTGLGRFFMGSVAERVLHDAELPVLMVHAGRDGSERA